MVVRTSYRLSLLKASLFLLLLSSYRLNVQADVIDSTRQEAELAFRGKEFDRELERQRVPHVFVGILARNVAHLLANFFGCVEHLDYPKESMSIW